MVRLFILAGQSNMNGGGNTAEIPSCRKTPPGNVHLYQDSEERPLLSRERFGPEIGFAQVLASAFPDDDIVLYKLGRSGANLYYDWNPDGKSQGPEDKYRGPLYSMLFTEVEALRQRYAVGNTLPEVSGMVWMQGERDAVFEVMAHAYERNLTAFLSAVRRDTGNRKLPVMIGQIAPRQYRLDDNTFQHPFRHVVQQAQRTVASADALVELVETTDLPQNDNLHFDTAGQLLLGRRSANAYLKLLTLNATQQPSF